MPAICFCVAARFESIATLMALDPNAYVSLPPNKVIPFESYKINGRLYAGTYYPKSVIRPKQGNYQNIIAFFHLLSAFLSGRLRRLCIEVIADCGRMRMYKMPKEMLA